jgi:hypothetical protein
VFVLKIDAEFVVGELKALTMEVYLAAVVEF